MRILGQRLLVYILSAVVALPVSGRVPSSASQTTRTPASSPPLAVERQEVVKKRLKELRKHRSLQQAARGLKPRLSSHAYGQLQELMKSVKEAPLPKMRLNGPQLQMWIDNRLVVFEILPGQDFVRINGQKFLFSRHFSLKVQYEMLKALLEKQFATAAGHWSEIFLPRAHAFALALAAIAVLTFGLFAFTPGLFGKGKAMASEWFADRLPAGAKATGSAVALDGRQAVETESELDKLLVICECYKKPSGAEGCDQESIGRELEVGPRAGQVHGEDQRREGIRESLRNLKILAFEGCQGEYKAGGAKGSGCEKADQLKACVDDSEFKFKLSQYVFLRQSVDQLNQLRRNSILSPPPESQ